MLPLNANGDPEYATVVITADCTQEEPGAHVDRSKLVSSRTPEEMLEGLAAYYGDTTFANEYGAAARQCADIDVIYVYRPPNRPEVLKVITGTGGYRALIDHAGFGGGSTLLTDRHILSCISEVERSIGRRRLFLLKVDEMLPSDVTSPADWLATVEAA